MREVGKKGSLIPFPQIPDGLMDKYHVPDLLLRPFGTVEEDLEIDFDEKTRPSLVTQILVCCTADQKGGSLSQAFFWDLTIGKRIECLLTIATSGDVPSLLIPLRCLRPSCQNEMEVEVLVEELSGLQRQRDALDLLSLRMGEERLVLKRPTGGDQLSWLQHSFTGEDDAVKEIIRTLISGRDIDSSHGKGAISDEWVPILNQAMEEFDPLVNFRLSVHCPYCGKESRFEIDLEELSLGKLRKAQRDLFEVVHRLAFHYHWSERRILSISPWRRSHYLNLIEKEEDRWKAISLASSDRQA